MGHGRHVESSTERAVRARTLAGLFAAGALLSVVVLLLPGWEDLWTAGIVASVVAAGGSAAALYLLADRVGRSMTHVATASGTLLIAACQVFARGGSPTAMYAMLYIWVVLHCSLFFSRAVVAGHLVTTTVAHTLALIWLGDVGAIAPQLAITLGTQLAAALVVASLAGRQRTLADTDPLTGLGNRRLAERALVAAIEGCRRTPDASVCVALLDLDGFKAFNDRRGHVAGDLILVEVAENWRRLARSTDTLARTGGDEFLLVLHGCDLDAAEPLVRDMVDQLPGGVSCSAGLARCVPHETPRMLLQRADDALYRAKAAGPLVVAPTAAADVGASA